MATSPTKPVPSEPSLLRIVLAEDHVFVRELMSLFLARERKRCRVVAEAATAQEAMEACRLHEPHLLILDLNLPGMSGIEALPLLRAQFPAMRLLICSGSVDDAQVSEALRAGPDGFIEKTSHRERFLEAIEAVASGGNYYCERSRRVLHEIARGSHAKAPETPAKGASSQLTAREKEVLPLIASGKTTKEAAAWLGVSEGTLVTHRANLMRKLNAHNAAELTRHALRQGWAN